VGMHRRKPTPARNTRSAFTQVSQAVCIGCLGALIHREVKCSATRGHRHRWQSPHRRRAARPRRLLCEPFVSRFEVVAFRGYHSFLLLELLYQRFSLHPPARELGLGSETQAAHLSLKRPNRLQALPQDRCQQLGFWRVAAAHDEQQQATRGPSPREHRPLPTRHGLSGCWLTTSLSGSGAEGKFAASSCILLCSDASLATGESVV